MSSLLLVLYSGSLFLSAFLAFSLQPMVGKMVLPLLGGSPSVWNTCMVFYQAVLLAGYAYSHLLSTKLRLRNQLIVHVVVLALPLLLLPIALSGRAQPSGAGDPTLWLLGTLLIVVALPFFAVTTTAPLLQRWFTATAHEDAGDPYFLYAASNLGSLLALLAYPLLIERFLPLGMQSGVWSVAYGVAIAAIAVSGIVALRGVAVPAGTGLGNSTGPAGEGEETGGNAPASGGGPFRWLLYSFLPSSLLLGVTHYMSTDIAVVPLFWVVPLALYLLTFVLVFARRPPIPYPLVLRIFPGVLVGLVLLLLMNASRPILLVYPVHLIAFFLAAMMCHGELVRLRPPATDLTRFYLWIAAGGALGGIFNALVAPLIFKGIAEYPLVLFFLALAIPYEKSKHRTREWRKDLLVVLVLVAVVIGVPALLEWIGLNMEQSVSRTPLYAAAAFFCYLGSRNRRRFGLAVGGLMFAGLIFTGFGGGRTLYSKRSFFGVSRVVYYEEDGTAFHNLTHGNTRHGLQSVDGERGREPLLYYHPKGPGGDVMQVVTERAPAARVGAIGLGTGAMAAYGLPEQHWTFFEIDPVVREIATDPRYFTYLSESQAEWEVVLGDGRLSIAGASPGEFDLIIVDAYGSDAIPVHTITREAVELYVDKLAEGGIIAFHISNLFLDLEPVLAGISRSLGLVSLIRNDDGITPEEKAMGRAASTWAVLARRGEDILPIARLPNWRPLGERPGMRVWSDDFTNLLSVIRWD